MTKTATIQTTTQNYFSVFDLPIQYVIDEQQLKAIYNTLIAKYHPDNFIADTAKHLEALEYTAYINTAFKTLSDATGRGAYLLSLNGINAFDEYDTKMNPEFLGKQIHLQEELETLHNEDELEEFLKEIEHQINFHTKAIENAYKDQNFSSMKNLVRELKFYAQLHSITGQKLDAFM